MAEWEADFPKFILVRGVRWTIRLEEASWKGSKSFHGLTDFAHKTIHIVRDQSPDDLLDTLLHELTHLLWSEYGLPKRPTEERVATSLGAGWAGLFVQNPGLTRTIDSLRAAIGGPDQCRDLRSGE